VLDIEKMLDRMIKSKIEGIYDALGWSMTGICWYWKRKKPKKGSGQLSLGI
jgi:hypothetical protein